MAKRQGIMLCYPFEERRLTEAKFAWKWPVWVQPKLDGERARSMDDKVGLQSSTAVYINSVPHIEDTLKRVQAMLDFPLLFDGELYRHGWTFNEIASVVGRTVNLHDDYQMIEYHVFDWMMSNTDQFMRKCELLTVFNEIRANISDEEWLSFPIRLVPTEPAFNLKQMYDLGMKWINSDYEGFIVRSNDLMWEAKRSNKILKFKPKKNDIYRIVDIIEATTNEDRFNEQTGEQIAFKNEPLGMVGKFICISEGQTFPIGAGKLTHAERREIWVSKDAYIGKWLNVQYQSLTAGGNANGVPRFGLATSIPFEQNDITD